MALKNDAILKPQSSVILALKIHTHDSYLFLWCKTFDVTVPLSLYLDSQVFHSQKMSIQRTWEPIVCPKKEGKHKRILEELEYYRFIQTMPGNTLLQYGLWVGELLHGTVWKATQTPICPQQTSLIIGVHFVQVQKVQGGSVSRLSPDQTRPDMTRPNRTWPLAVTRTTTHCLYPETHQNNAPRATHLV